MASLGLAFGAWGLPWESGDAPGIGGSGDARMLLLRGRRRRLLLEQTSPGGWAAALGWRLLVAKSKNGLLSESELGF